MNWKMFYHSKPSKEEVIDDWYSQRLIVNSNGEERVIDWKEVILILDSL